MCFAVIKTQGQTTIIDSLKQIYKKAVPAEARLKALLTLCEYHQSIQKDSLYRYATEAGELAGISIDKIDKGRSAALKANAYLRFGKIDSAEIVVNANLPLYQVKDPETRSLYFLFSALQVDCFGEKTNYEDAVEALYKIINLAEQYKDYAVLAKNMS
ncbi:MAG TPA: hypothetical protein PKY82_19195, partial [Pyrinomonadaceae bacterium]|nr:hypothetical protein [Pyrinomonadaceae bacterium]